jgi:ubiquinone/menaquinone biosynthesis C-methylase UbiE
MNRDKHDCLQQSKRDLSWQRYEDGWPDIVDRYNVTAALVRDDVLDVGCGQCLLGRLLPSAGRYVGLDSWDEMLAEASERGAFEIRLGEAEKLPFADGEFDCVVLGQVLEHVYDADKSVSEALRVLRHGGRLIVNVPADDAEPHGLHVRVFRSVDEMKALFGEAVNWEGEGRLHRYWFAWGEKCG